MSKFGSAMRRNPPEEGWAAQGRARRSSSGYAIAAGYLGLFSMFPFVGPFAALFGLLALRDMQRRPDLRGAWRAKLGVAAGALGTIVYGALWLLGKIG
jgi:hypothetical protein